jgi:hypothetical protein
MAAMIDKENISKLLGLHQKAYRLLLFLAEQAKSNPSAFTDVVVEALSRKTSCARWLSANAAWIPKELKPKGEDASGFSALFSSFFGTSFRIDTLEWDGKAVDSTLRTGSRSGSISIRNVKHLKAMSLKYLCSQEGVRLDAARAGQLAGHKSIERELSLWAYVWGLDRRRKGKSKGPVVHKLWRSIPIDVRKNLTTDAVWNARQRLMQHVLSHAGSPDS